MHKNLGRKQDIPDSLCESQIWWTVSVGSENWRMSLYPVTIFPTVAEGKCILLKIFDGAQYIISISLYMTPFIFNP